MDKSKEKLDQELIKAVQDKNHKTIDELIAKGANVGVKDINGNTPAHNATAFADCLTIKALINNKANIAVLNDANKTALDLINENQDFKKTVVSSFYWEYEENCKEELEKLNKDKTLTILELEQACFNKTEARKKIEIGLEKLKEPVNETRVDKINHKVLDELVIKEEQEIENSLVAQ